MTIGCLTFTIDRIGGIEASATRVPVPTTATAVREGGIIASLGLVCGTDLGIGTVLWSSDAKLMTIDGGFLLVREN